MTYQICYWDEASQSQKERDATPQEAAEIDALKTAPAQVPQEVSRFQAIAALSNAGVLAQTQSAVNASTNPLTAIAWNNAQAFRRDSQMIADLAPAIPLTSDQVDQLFIAAAKIKA